MGRCEDCLGIRRGLCSPEVRPSENWASAVPIRGREAGWGRLLTEPAFFPSIVPDSYTWKVQHPPRPMCFPSSPSLSREGTDGRNLCPNPSLAALALGRGDAGAEIHPGSTSFSQHPGKRAAAGASQGQEQKRTAGRERGEEGTCRWGVTVAFQPVCHQGICILSAQFCKQETLAPVSNTRKLRLTCSKITQLVTSCRSRIPIQICPTPKTVSSPADPTEGGSCVFRPLPTLPLKGHLG